MPELTQVELFSGGGGMALGLARAGFRTLGHVEKDEAAGQTFQFNFVPMHKAEILRAGDITLINSPKTFLHGLEEGQLDLLAGGPPCQAYSKAGRGKLAQIRGSRDAHLEDPRGQLYKDYLKFVWELRPRAVLMENVPDIMNYGGDNIAGLICQDLAEAGYRSAYTVLNASDYGVPQARERWILIAFRDDLDVNPSFPMPTHLGESSAESAFSPILTLKKHLEEGSPFARLPPEPDGNLPKAVTVGDAFGDLPVTSAWYDGEECKFEFCKQLSDALPYRSDPQHPFQVEMRSWPGLPTVDSVTANLFRLTYRDFPIFSRMKADDRYSRACTVADQILFERAQRAGFGTRSLAQLKKYLAVWRTDLRPRERNEILRSAEGRLLSEVVPPYDQTQFLDKWRVLNPKAPAHTVVAHLSVDTYSHIHYDPRQARAVTVREAARLQSFPDGFLFPGNMGQAYKQIGNAVPPLLAWAIGKYIGKTLDGVRVSL